MPDPLHETRTRELEALVGRDPATALYLPLAERLREEGRVEEAIRLCESRKNRPGRGVGDAIVLGRCYLADGRLNEARSAFEAALALDRENVAALKALAGILAHEGRHAASVDLYRAVCRVDSGDLESQTALHQITSGEYADVCPADVVVGQGDLGWQPVRLPREEENLPDLALGLRTIETFETTSPDPAGARARDFQEFTLDDLEQATAAIPSAAPGPSWAPPDLPADLPAADRRAPAPGEPPAPAAPPPDPPDPSARLAADAERGGAAALPGTVKGNRSAFEDWLRRMGGGS